MLPRLCHLPASAESGIVDVGASRTAVLRWLVDLEARHEFVSRRLRSFAQLFETFFPITFLIRLTMGFGRPERVTSPFASMYPTTVKTIGLHVDSSSGAGERDVSQRWDRGSIDIHRPR